MLRVCKDVYFVLFVICSIVRLSYCKFKAGCKINSIYYSAPKTEGYRFSVVRLAVRPSGCLDVWMSVTNLLGYISKTITDLNMKLQGYIDLIEK